MYIYFEQRRERVLGIWEYTFRPERPVDFVPGQYVNVYIPDIIDPRGSTRTFSLTSLPDDPSLQFITKHFDLQSPYKGALQTFQVGDNARIGDAMGDLVLPKVSTIPLVFIAGGIGIASYISMLRSLIARREERPIFLFYAMRSKREQLFSDLLASYPFAFTSHIVAPNHLTAQEVRDTTPPHALIYLSGSQSFVERLQAEFEHLGTPRSQIVFDYYDGYADL
jgi:glycine betaine catabolism B